jgi:hypothetical protein
MVPRAALEMNRAAEMIKERPSSRQAKGLNHGAPAARRRPFSRATWNRTRPFSDSRTPNSGLTRSPSRVGGVKRGAPRVSPGGRRCLCVQDSRVSLACDSSRIRWFPSRVGRAGSPERSGRFDPCEKNVTDGRLPHTAGTHPRPAPFAANR